MINNIRMEYNGAVLTVGIFGLFLSVLFLVAGIASGDLSPMSPVYYIVISILFCISVSCIIYQIANCILYRIRLQNRLDNNNPVNDEEPNENDPLVPF